MAGNMTDYLEKKMLDSILGVAAYTFPATTYLALFTADPTDTGSVVNEIAEISYQRVSLNGKFSAASGTSGISSNSDVISYALAQTDWGTITHIGIMESDTKGTDDMLFYGALSLAIIVNSSETFAITAGNLTLTLG